MNQTCVGREQTHNKTSTRARINEPDTVRATLVGITGGKDSNKQMRPETKTHKKQK
jgi:hypothetical protein